MPPPEEDPAWSYDDLGILIGMVLPSLVIAALGAKLMAAFIPQKGIVASIAQILIYSGVGGSLYMLLKIRYGLDFWRAMSWRVKAAATPWMALLGPMLAVAMVLLLVILGTTTEPTALDALMKDRASLIAIGLTASTIGPLFEELVFRGFAQPLFVRSLGLAGGLLATAIPFSLLHGPQYNWSWRRMLVMFLASCAFGLVRWRTGSTAASTLMHSAYNLTFVVGALLEMEKHK